MTPRTKRIAWTAVATWHDDLLLEARVLRKVDRSDPNMILRRRKVASRLLDARYALREINRSPIELPRNECE